MPGWTRETIDGTRAADWKYTRVWLEAMRAFDKGRTPREAMDLYNEQMAFAKRDWDDEIRAAVALSEDPF